MIERTFSDADFARPVAVCDIIMKGGITSGVVYPLAITELAKHYRFANIGGTSAGAIAAAAAAAAEYARDIPGKGFMRLTRLPEESGAILFSLFQPTAAVVAFIAWRYGGIGGVAFGVLLAIVGLIIGLIVGLARALTKHLPANNYGLCGGIRQPGFAGPGFTDWLADLIAETGGRDPRRDPPLTFGDLASPSGGRPPIALRMMTTNLMLKRPYTLPFQDQVYTFKREDFAQIFPRRIMDYLVAHSERFAPEAGEEGEYYKFPAAETPPVVVAARMSLSFPVLISAVPLYARDRTLKGDDSKKLRLCLFSDGGLSSNFPIHFFDRMLPNAPTFGISLGEYDRRRDRGSSDAADAKAVGNPSPAGEHESRVWMPQTARSGQLLPIEPFHGLAGFLARLINAAKDWQDSLQSTLAGYRDRIVHIDLKPEEGGLNIVMPPDLVRTLGEYGAEAGVTLRDDFNFDEHRWHRFLVAMDRLDETLNNFTDAYHGLPKSAESFEAFLTRYPQDAGSYKQAADDLALLRARAAELAKIGEAWSRQPDIPEGTLPHPKTDLRITPKP